MNALDWQNESVGQPIVSANEVIEMADLHITKEPASSLAPELDSIEPIAINNKDHKLPLLNYKPFFLRPWALIVTLLLNLAWIGWLVYVYIIVTITGPKFLLDGLLFGFVATLAKFFISSQIMGMGKIILYKNMLSGTEPNVQNTIDSDYWPYEWPIPRPRAFLNEDYFFQFVDIVAFLFTYAVVQFESNILNQNEDYSYTANRGVVIIVIICHGVVAVTTLGIFLWLINKETGLLADPGCLALCLALLDKADIQQDFQGIQAEDRRWIVRKRLEKNHYRIGYWRKSQQAVYGIRKVVPKTARKISASLSPVSEETLRVSNKYPEFRYVPWFLKSFWIVIWTATLAAGLSIIATLVIYDDIIYWGFAPHASTEIIPFVEISPAAFVWSFFPSFAAELFAMLVQSIDIFYRLVQPYADMKRKDAKPEAIINCFQINYTNDLPIIVTLRALGNHHFSVAVTSTFSIAAGSAPAFAANMFYIYEGWVNVFPPYLYVTLVYMGLFILFFLWAIPDQSRHMPRDLETIADHMALYSQSSLLDDGVFQIDISPITNRSPSSGNIRLRFKDWVSSIMKLKNKSFTALSTIKNGGWKKTWTSFKEAVFGPPELIAKVLKKLKEISSSGPTSTSKGRVPRFGT